MEEKKVLIATMDQLIPEVIENDNQYGFTEYNLTYDDAGKHCNVSFYRLPAGKANYPYHYHLDQEEVFYIISGRGILRTPQGEREVKAGEMMFFPAGPEGAHKLTNASDTEDLIYIDFDSRAHMDVAIYPDSQKIGVWSPDTYGTFFLKDKAKYYDGEE